MTIRPAGKWIKGIRADMPARRAARRALRSRLRAVARLILMLLEQHRDDSGADPQFVHRLRVSTRRATAAIDAFSPVLRAGRARKAVATLRALRRAAADARDCDVHRALFSGTLPGAPEGDRPALLHVLERIDHDRARAARQLGKALRRAKPRRLRGAHARLVRRRCDAGPTGAGGAAPVTALDLARSSLAARAEDFRRAGEQPLAEIENVHALRLAGKSLRYGLETLAVCLDARVRDELFPRLADLLDRLGQLNDAHQVVHRLDRYRAELSPGARDPGLAPAPDESAEALLRAIDSFTGRLRARRDRLHAELQAGWPEFNSGEFVQALNTLLGPAPGATGAAPRAVDQPAHRVPQEAMPVTPLMPGTRARIGAIDVGSNSIRLIIAEVSADGSYRVMDDEREVARLGSRLHSRGTLDPRAMQHAALTIARMKGIADGYGVRLLRVVGTSAVREARNTPEFIQLVRRAAGVELEVISAEQEAMLSYRSAARAFDLASAPGAVVDIGGGSTQIVVSAPAAPVQRPGAADTGPALPELGGVVERVYTIALGAVRLTERFGGPDNAAGSRFREMRRFIKRRFRREAGAPPLAPQLVVATGGTFTTLASICAQAELGPAADGLFAGTLQGREVKLAQLKHALDRLRKMPLRRRAEVRGLGADRADIIVAGLALAERVMKTLGVSSVRIHEGGIRDGLLLEMAHRLRQTDPAGAPRPSDPMRSVRRFARACGYEQAHSRHVARLALRIFDQLGVYPALAQTFSARDRVLLESAAILHDIGYLINYSGHHKHSYHLIIHADLPGLTSREVEVVANLARYHRLAEPTRTHPGFARLGRDDRRLVKRLSGILRVADGLDRTHTQGVRDVRVEIAGRSARFMIAAAGEPTVDIWGAERKSGLFEAALGLRPRFEFEPVRTTSVEADAPVA